MELIHSTIDGLGQFFSSIYSRAVPGIAFQTLSLINVMIRSSWSLLIEQILPKPKQQKSTTTATKKVKRAKGRPKGAKNKNHHDVQLNAEMTQVNALLTRLLKLTKGILSVVYFVYDGAFGNNTAVQMTRQVGLHLISKLRNNSALHFKYSGTYSGQGRRRIDGCRVNYTRHLS